MDLSADAGSQIMEGGQAVHEDYVILGIGKRLGVDLIGSQVPDTLIPNLSGLTHGNPHIGIDNIRVRTCYLDVMVKAYRATGLLSLFYRVNHKLIIGIILGVGADNKVHAQLCTGHHKGIAHVISGISHINELEASEISLFLLDGKHIRYHLSGMGLIGKAVPDRNSRILGQLLNDDLAVASVLDTVIHTAQHSCRIGDAFLFTYLRSVGIKIGNVHAQIVGCNFKGASGPGTCLFEYKGNVFAAKLVVGNALFLFFLEFCCQINKVLYFLFGKILHFKEISST